MKGTKFLSELITDPHSILPGKINIVEANTSGGKTWFALNTLPEWAGSPEKVLYLIDTSNGELRLQQNIIAVSRLEYALSDYASGRLWGEFADMAKEKMPVMTYAGFGAEIRSSGKPFWQKFEYQTVSTSRFDSTRFKKEHADLAAAYTKSTTYRRFSVR